MDLWASRLSFDRYPLITLSTRSQVEKRKAHTGTLNAVKRIVDREGISGLYAGLESALFGITVTNFVYYYCTLPHLTTRSKTLVLITRMQGMSSRAPSSSELLASLVSAHWSPWAQAPWLAVRPS